jgi:hypothetical protein
VVEYRPISFGGKYEKEKDKKGENIKEKGRKTKHLKFEVKRVKINASCKMNINK